MKIKFVPKTAPPEEITIGKWTLTLWTHLYGHGVARFTVTASHPEQDPITRSGLIRDDVLNNIVKAMPQETP